MITRYSIAAEKQQGNKVKSTTNQNGNEQQQNSKPEPTWIHDIFQGTLTNETRCLNCETVSKKNLTSFSVYIIIFSIDFYLGILFLALLLFL